MEKKSQFSCRYYKTHNEVLNVSFHEADGLLIHRSKVVIELEYNSL